jgi:glycosyltransferase involved in cell wall biosynthesis
MNIHLLGASASRSGGGDVYTENLALGLAARGHKVTVICHGASDAVREACSTAFATLPDYDAWRGLWRIGPWLRWRFWQQYLSQVDVGDPDVVICSKSICTAALARRFPGVPLVYLPHSRIEPMEIESILAPGSSWVQRRLACSISSTCERRSLIQATTTVRFTAENVTELKRHYRLPQCVRFDVIPAGVVGPASVRPRQTDSSPRLLSLGRLVASKNLAFLLDVLASLADLPWILDLVGDGPERVRLEQQAARLGLTGRIRFHGQRDDVAPFYEQADLFVFPSRLESFGLVVLEAMSFGVPTLGIRSDGRRYRNANHEIITPRHDGLLAENEDAFREELRDCLINPAALPELGEQARQTYLARHRWPVVLERWQELLTQLVSGREPARRIAGGTQRHATPVATAAAT